MTKRQRRAIFRHAAEIADVEQIGGCLAIHMACNKAGVRGQPRHNLTDEFARYFKNRWSDAYWWGLPPRGRNSYPRYKSYLKGQQARVLALLLMAEMT